VFALPFDKLSQFLFFYWGGPRPHALTMVRQSAHWSVYWLWYCDPWSY